MEAEVEDMIARVGSATSNPNGSPAKNSGTGLPVYRGSSEG
jgi:hypothetical protein